MRTHPEIHALRNYVDDGYPVVAELVPNTPAPQSGTIMVSRRCPMWHIYSQTAERLLAWLLLVARPSANSDLQSASVHQVDDILISVNGMDMRNISGVDLATALDHQLADGTCTLALLRQVSLLQDSHWQPMMSCPKFNTRKHMPTQFISNASQFSSFISNDSRHFLAASTLISASKTCSNMALALQQARKCHAVRQASAR